MPASITASTQQVQRTKSTLRTKVDKIDRKLEKFYKRSNELEKKFNSKFQAIDDNLHAKADICELKEIIQQLTILIVVIRNTIKHKA